MYNDAHIILLQNIILLFVIYVVMQIKFSYAHNVFCNTK